MYVEVISELIFLILNLRIKSLLPRVWIITRLVPCSFSKYHCLPPLPGTWAWRLLTHTRKCKRSHEGGALPPARCEAGGCPARTSLGLGSPRQESLLRRKPSGELGFHAYGNVWALLWNTREGLWFKVEKSAMRIALPWSRRTILEL